MTPGALSRSGAGGSWGKTRGYIHHPQLIRFRNTSFPEESIASCLQAVHAKTARLGYHFDASKIASAGYAELIAATCGQLDYEWALLKEKLRIRSPRWLATLESVSRPDPHPLFRIVPGAVEEWEIVRPKRVAFPAGR